MSIYGYIPQVENQEKHRSFLTNLNASLELIMLKITDARALVNKGLTADDFAGKNTKVITTTTIMDEKLEHLGWKDELKIIQEFRPEYHIPVDVPVYPSQEDHHRWKNIRTYLEGIIWMEERVSDTKLIPLIKGETRDERRFVKTVVDYFDYDYVCFYSTQLVMDGMGKSRIIGKINKIANEFEDKKILLMGLQSPAYVKNLLENVVAVSGQRWRTKVKPGEAEENEMRRRYSILRDNVIHAIDQKQQSLSNYMVSA